MKMILRTFANASVQSSCPKNEVGLDNQKLVAPLLGKILQPSVKRRIKTTQPPAPRIGQVPVPRDAAAGEETCSLLFKVHVPHTTYKVTGALQHALCMPATRTFLLHTSIQTCTVMTRRVEQITSTTELHELVDYETFSNEEQAKPSCI